MRCLDRLKRALTLMNIAFPNISWDFVVEHREFEIVNPDIQNGRFQLYAITKNGIDIIIGYKMFRNLQGSTEAQRDARGYLLRLSDEYSPIAFQMDGSPDGCYEVRISLRCTDTVDELKYALVQALIQLWGFLDREYECILEELSQLDVMFEGDC